MTEIMKKRMSTEIIWTQFLEFSRTCNNMLEIEKPSHKIKRCNITKLNCNFYECLSFRNHFLNRKTKLGEKIGKK